MSKKTCFFVTPIGSNNSPERKISDFVMAVHLKPTLKKFGYTVERADSSPSVERIDQSVLEHVQSSDLVIADVSGNNPNVMFELGYRIALDKPYIIIAQDVNELPFDISGIRTLFYETLAPNVLEFNAQLEHTVRDVINKTDDKRNLTDKSTNEFQENDSKKEDPNYQAGQKMGQELITEAIKTKDFSKLKDFAEIAKLFGVTSENSANP
ncbi:hypothetical protein V6O07_02110 [Arthrospira platensis SPKY2]